MDKPVRDIDHNLGEESKLAKKIKNFIYHPSDLIGSGFSSHVYKGIDEVGTDPDNKQIAIKVIELSKIQNQVQKYLLNNEVNALKALKHPNILQTVDILMTKNNVYIVTEFCEDGDLLNFIKNKGKLSELSSLKIARDIVEGYILIQEKNIIHRDLKTSNIFLSKGKAKIADFGFCEFIGQKKPQIAYNVGSPAYMSPQSYKQNQYSHKSDIWAIGIILYEMLVGETPDRNLTYTEMVTNLMNGNIKLINNEEIKKILSLCFKKNIHERISAKHLGELLQAEIQRTSGNEAPKQIRKISSQQPSTIQQSSVQPAVQQPAIQQQQPAMMTSMTPALRQTQIPQQRTLSPAKFRDFSGIGKTEQKVVRPNRLSQASHERSMTQEKNSETKINEPERENTSIKGHTQILLFLYRLLKFASEIRLEKIRQIYLILFRHRIYIENMVERCDLKQTQQPYKEFQYLKTRFDEVYLQKKEVTTQGIYKQPMLRYSNSSFVDPEALKLYIHILRDVSGDCVMSLQARGDDVNLNQTSIVLDYLLLQNEILNLHLNNSSLSSIISTTKIDTIVREQPKRITNAHIDLLKLKYKHFMMNPFSQERPIEQYKSAFQPRETMSVLGQRY